MSVGTDFCPGEFAHSTFLPAPSNQSGVVSRELAERAGHARASMGLDVYSHVMPLDEIAADQLEAAIRC